MPPVPEGEEETEDAREASFIREDWDNKTELGKSIYYEADDEVDSTNQTIAQKSVRKPLENKEPTNGDVEKKKPELTKVFAEDIDNAD